VSFECAECGRVSMKWLGKCPSCGEWDTYTESGEFGQEPSSSEGLLDAGAETLSRVKVSSRERIKTGIPGLDRLLGGGVVPGEVILLGGPPGVGKSTLFLQIAGKMASSGKKVLYVSGEESPSQIKIHADRLKINGENITVLGSGNLENLRILAGKLSPEAVFVDSVQAVADPSGGGAPGTVKQVKLSGQKITALAKNSSSVFFLSGQITKQGDMAGPKLLEHMVDAVLYIEPGDGNERVVSAVKNRFGSCGDFLLLSLGSRGLTEAENPGADAGMRNRVIPGRAYCCVKSGKRVVTAEIQALLSPSYFEYPLRRTSGFSRERLLMLSAVAEKYLGAKASGMDIYMNVSGVTRLQERSADLAAVTALYSGISGIAVPGNMVFMGELGLGGEVRRLRDAAERYAFASRNGFKSVVIPGSSGKIKRQQAEIIFIDQLSRIKEIIASDGG